VPSVAALTGLSAVGAMVAGSGASRNDASEARSACGSNTRAPQSVLSDSQLAASVSSAQTAMACADCLAVGEGIFRNLETEMENSDDVALIVNGESESESYLMREGNGKGSRTLGGCGLEKSEGRSGWCLDPAQQGGEKIEET
jgi:hypothetical protein